MFIGYKPNFDRDRRKSEDAALRDAWLKRGVIKRCEPHDPAIKMPVHMRVKQAKGRVHIKNAMDWKGN